MTENYIMLNGKRFDLTDRQVKEIESYISPPKIKSIIGKKLEQLFCPHDWDTWNRKFICERGRIDDATLKCYRYTCKICGKETTRWYYS